MYQTSNNVESVQFSKFLKVCRCIRIFGMMRQRHDLRYIMRKVAHLFICIPSIISVKVLITIVRFTPIHFSQSELYIIFYKHYLFRNILVIKLLSYSFSTA